MTVKLSEKTITAAIGVFTTSRDKLMAMGQDIGLDIITFAAPKEAFEGAGGSGNCTLALSLGAAMPKTWGEQLTAWFAKYTPIRINIKNGKAEYAAEYKKLSSEEKLGWWDIIGARQNPFHTIDTKTQRAPASFDLFEMMKFVKAQAAKVQKQLDEDLVPSDDIEVARNLLAQLNGIKVAPALKAVETPAVETKAA